MLNILIPVYVYFNTVGLQSSCLILVSNKKYLYTMS